MNIPMEYPEVFYDQSLIQTRNPRQLCADALVAWGNCHMGIKPPESFGEVLVAISAKIGMKEAATGDNLIAFANKHYLQAP